MATEFLSSESTAPEAQASLAAAPVPGQTLTLPLAIAPRRMSTSMAGTLELSSGDEPVAHRTAVQPPALGRRLRPLVVTFF